MKRPPPTFARSTYVAWHNDAHPEDRDVAQRVADLRETLRRDAATQLRLLGQVLSQVAEHTEREVRLQTNGLLPRAFSLPSEKIAGTTARQGKKHRIGVPDDELFKPTESILEKMWRLNRRRSADEEDVSLSNLQTEITDLIRTSVVSPTLLHARAYTLRLGHWRDYIRSDGMSSDTSVAPLSSLRRISIEPEAKMATGYFAFHALAEFEGELRVEIQVFSDLTSAWRSISHRLYEMTRVGGIADTRPGTRDARLASLGHLLHLADCEIERLAREFAKDSESGP